jgi:serine phosphatase RsbU (regulator of sigma subunit)
MLEKLAIVGLTEKQKEMINKSFKKSKNPYPLESILEKPQQPIVDNGEKIKPEEFYKKNWGDASNISKEEVIKLLNNFARILEMERKRNKQIN